jgi:DNA (cytosine-5)-methyltransferase 1
VKKLKILELFGGIGACSKALEKLRIEYEISDYVEIDKYVVKSYNAMHDTNFEPQDICTWDKDIDVDLIMHGSPCQDFSLAGKQAGGDEGSGTRSSLMYETIRIVKKLKPKYVIWENVKNVISKKHRHNFDNYLNKMEELGYKNYWQVLNAKDYGIPQNRERVFTISIRNEISIDFVFPEKQELKLKLKDILEKNVEEKYFLSEAMLNYMYGVNQKPSKFSRRERFEANINRKNQDVANSVTTNAGNRPTDNFIKIKNATKKGYLEATAGDGIDLAQPNSKTRRGRVQKEAIQTLTTQNNLGVVNSDLRIRKLTPKECWRLMGFDDEDFEKAEKINSNTQLYKQAGNSIVINVLMAIFKELLIEEV